MTDIVPDARACLQQSVLGYELEEIENCFDDLHSALDMAKEFIDSVNEPSKDVMKFFSETQKVEKEFRKAIYNLGKQEQMKHFEASQEAYHRAFQKGSFPGKFVWQWKKIQSSKVRNIVSF